MPYSGALRKPLGIGLAVLATLSPAIAQEPGDAEQLRKICKAILCREPGSVRLTLDNGETFETTFAVPLPIVQNEWVSIYPGETVFVEADVSGERLVNLKAVETNRHPEKTLEFKFTQESANSSMMLTVKNPFHKFVKYHAAMMLPSADRLLKTSSCPVLGDGRIAFEAWPHAIFQLALFDFRLLDERDHR